MINFIKKPVGIISFILILGLAAGGYFYFGRTEKPEFDVTIAKRSDLIQEVSVTGRVKPARSVELAFEKSGKVALVYVDVGNKVVAGQTLVTLENSELAAQILQAEAGVESAQAQLEQYRAALEAQKAKLAELKRGTRPEEIQVQETKVANAKTTLEDAKKNLVDKLQDAYTKSDDAVRGKADQMFTNSQTQNPQLKFWAIDSSLESDVEWRRLLLEYNVFPKWRPSLDALTIQSNLTAYMSEAKKHLDEVKIFLDKLSLIVNNPNTSYVVNGISQDIPSSWKTDTATARTNINTAISNISTAEEKLRKAESDISLAEQELALKKAGAIEEQIAAQEAQIKQAEANISSQEAQIKSAKAGVENYRAQIAKTIIRAPITGTVTKQDAKVGEIVSANTPIVSLISASQFEIEANIPEADIAKVKLGNTAKVTLDAYGNDVGFNVKIVAIDPAETIIDGVATYKTTFQFTDKDERIKSGMTANIDISTEKRENVIIVPQRAVIAKNGDKIVKILNGETPKEAKVKTGLRGSDGNIEIIEGINEGDKVIISFE